MADDDLGYLFGCCAACRALFEPSTVEMMYPESQAWAYLIARVREVAQKNNMGVQLTGGKHRSHLVMRAKFSRALDFSFKMQQAQLTQAIPGWNSNIRQVQFNGPAKDGMYCSQITESRGPAPRRATSAQDDPDLIREMQEARDDAVAAADAQEFAKIVLSKVSDTTDGLYYATWDAPVTQVQHARLTDWLNGTALRPVRVNLDKTTSCCSLCNNIWDCRARLRENFQDPTMIAPGSIACKEGSKKVAISLPTGDKTAMQKLIGCMVGYYLHACLRVLASTAGLQAENLDNDRRQPLTMLLWLPVHINAMYRELRQPLVAQDSDKKGFQNYVGCLDLLISYYLHVCASADPDLPAIDLPLEAFHVFYAKELAEAPAPVWDAAADGHRLHEFIFAGGYQLNWAYAAQIAHVSDRLCQLYRDRVFPVLQAVLDPPSADPNLASATGRFFLTRPETDELTRDYLLVSSQNQARTRLHLAQAGVHAITWQLRRALGEGAGDLFAPELDRWTNARMQVEWRNVAARMGDSDWALGDAQLIYYAQHTLDPPERAGLLALAWDSDDGQDGAVQELRRLGLCSPWKAALRLRRYEFTRPAPAEDQDDADDAVAALGSSMRLLRITNSPQQARAPASTPQTSARGRLASSAREAAAGRRGGSRSTA